MKIETTSRGFDIYGPPVTCSYGTIIDVRDSSSAEGPRLCLSLLEDKRVFNRTEPGRAAAHLTPEQACAIIDRLEAWLDSLPEKWWI